MKISVGWRTEMKPLNYQKQNVDVRKKVTLRKGIARECIKKLPFNVLNINRIKQSLIYSHTHKQDRGIRLGAAIPFPLSKPVRLSILGLSMLFCPANAPDTGTYPPWQLCLCWSLLLVTGSSSKAGDSYTLVSSSLFPPTVAFDGFYHLYFFYYYQVAGRRTNKRTDAILWEYSLWGISVVFQCHSDCVSWAPWHLLPEQCLAPFLWL